MNLGQLRYMTMFYGIIEIGASIIGLLSSLPLLGEAFDELKEKVLAISRIDIEIRDLTKGKIEARDEAREILINLLFPMAEICQAYAANEKKHTLLEIVDTTKSKLRNHRVNDLGQRSADILGAIKANKDDLAGYGLTEPMISNSETALTNFNKAQYERLSLYSLKSTKLARMEELFKETRELLDQVLDKEMAILESNHPEIYQWYINSRKLKKYPATRETPEESNSNNDLPDEEGEN